MIILMYVDSSGRRIKIQNFPLRRISHGKKLVGGINHVIVVGRVGVDDALETLALLPADVLPQVVELNAVFRGFVRKVGGNF